MTSWEEYLSDRTAIPPENEEKYQYVELVCTVKTYVKVPDEFELRIDAKNWIEDNYDMYDNKSKNYIFEDPNTEIFIEEIEYTTKEW